jgi:DNA-binding NarL/FixJ family response regulator
MLQDFQRTTVEPLTPKLNYVDALTTSNTTAAKQIAVCLVEDDVRTRESLVELLRRSSSVHLVGSYATGEEAVRDVPAARPQVVLVDINLPGINGIECVIKLKMVMPEINVLMLTTHDDGDLIFESLRAGASGYLLKNRAHAGLVDAVEQVNAGGAPMSMQIARKVVRFFQQVPARHHDLGTLTAREQEILALLATGRFYKEIGDQLGISLSTVRGHLHKVYSKLHVQSRTEAVLKYLGRG